MSIARHFLEGATPTTRTHMAIALDRGKNDPWELKTPRGTSHYTMHVDEHNARNNRMRAK